MIDPSGDQKRFTDILPYHEHWIDKWIDGLFGVPRGLPGECEAKEKLDPTVRGLFYSDYGGPFPYWRYGRYCGYDMNGPGKPINDLDEACQEHDDCLATWSQVIYFYGCNDKLCNDIKYIWNNQCIKRPFDERKCRAIFEMSVWCWSMPVWPPGQRWK